MPELTLPYGNSLLSVAIPDEWLGTVALPKEVTPTRGVRRLVRLALDAPTGSPPLGEIAQPGMRVALIVDDYTRKTPIRQVLPLVLDELLAAGVSPADIRIVIASGSHRLMSHAEITARLGRAIVDSYEVVTTSAEDQSQMLCLGETGVASNAGQGIPAWVNREVAEADLRIGIGMITPHLDAGFSGGAKIILPGACGITTIDAFHRASAFIPENPLGNPEAPLRRSLEQFVAEKAPLHFIVNLVLTLKGEVFACVAGDAVQAHRLGVKFAREVYGVPVQWRYPVVIANCYPYDQDLWQSVKGMWCGDLLAEDGGVMIVVTAAPEGSQAYPSLPAYIGRDPEELLGELLAGKSPDPMVAATGVMISRLRQRIRLVLVSSGLDRSDAQAMHIPLYNTVEEAVNDSVSQLPVNERKGCLAVLPYAGTVLPIYPM
jgi:nickel-dependent lactate racemase